MLINIKQILSAKVLLFFEKAVLCSNQHSFPYKKLAGLLSFLSCIVITVVIYTPGTGADGRCQAFSPRCHGITIRGGDSDVF